MSYERQAPQTPITVVDTNSVDLTASGAYNTTLQADVKISTLAGNIAVVNATGLYVPKDVLTTLAYNGATGALTYVDEDGATTTINLPLEKFLSAASYNDTTDILTLTLTDGTTFNVSLADLAPVASTSGIQGLGTTASPLKENFDALPAATATLPTTVKFVMAADGTNPDGSIASVAQVVAAIVGQICSATVAAWSATSPHYMFQNNGGTCQLVQIAAAPATCAAAPFDNMFLSSNGAMAKPTVRFNWLAAAVTASGALNIANNNAFRLSAAAGNIKVTVAAPTACDNTELLLKRADNSANTVAINFTGTTADGVASIALQPNSYWGGLRGESLMLSWNGTEWSIV